MVVPNRTGHIEVFIPSLRCCYQKILRVRGEGWGKSVCVSTLRMLWQLKYNQLTPPYHHPQNSPAPALFEWLHTWDSEHYWDYYVHRITPAVSTIHFLNNPVSFIERLSCLFAAIGLIFQCSFQAQSWYREAGDELLQIQNQKSFSTGKVYSKGNLRKTSKICLPLAAIHLGIGGSAKLPPHPMPLGTWSQVLSKRKQVQYSLIPISGGHLSTLLKPCKMKHD